MVDERLGEKFDKYDVSVDRTLAELAHVAHGNAADLVELNDLGDWDFNLGKLDSETITAQSVKVASATCYCHSMMIELGDRPRAVDRTVPCVWPRRAPYHRLHPEQG